MEVIDRAHYKTGMIQEELNRKWKEKQTTISQQKPPKDYKQLKKHNIRAAYKALINSNRPKI